MKRRRLMLIVVSVSTLVLIGVIWDGEILVRHEKKISSPQHREHYNNSLMWVVNIRPTDQKGKNIGINQIAHDLDLENLGQLGHFVDSYLFSIKVDRNLEANTSRKHVRSVSSFHQAHANLYSAEEIKEKIMEIENKLDRHDNIEWYTHQKIVSRVKRWMAFSDPYYRRQWHLTNTFEFGMDVNVTGVWRRNITGSGVTVSVVDDGLEWNNPDLELNYNKAGSWDFNDDDDDPMPDGSKESNHHGTRCAGEISAVPNNICGVGVAYGAKVSGLRILDGPMTDSLEASAFTKNFQVNDIYSCSWGPDDDGKTMDGPHVLAAAAMKHGIDFGRHGYGSIYVVASGNGGQSGDNCNFDGYANSLYTVTIGAVDEQGRMPYYSEECASMLAVTFSSGGGLSRDIVTTDWTATFKSARTGCTEHHTGTSAAAPIAAGLIALMLQVQPCLTWRDVQYLIILTAQKVDIDVAHWQKNGAGLWHSHKHGFGLMNAWRLTNAARVWNQVPWLTSFLYTDDVNIPITKGQHNPLIVSFTMTDKETRRYDLYTLETVQVTLTIDHPYRGHLDIRLKSPHGTMSVMGAARPKDDSMAGFDRWTFSTVRCWGETPLGTWTLTITDKDKSGQYGMGTLKSWSLKLYGTPMTPAQFKQRRKIIESAMHGRSLNGLSVCAPPPVTAQPDDIMSVKVIKMVVLTSAFLFVMAIYESLEYLLCYNDEKKENSKLRKLVTRAHILAGQVLNGEPRNPQSNLPSERTGLLSEEIPMETFHSNDLERSSLGNDWLTIERPPDDHENSGDASSTEIGCYGNLNTHDKACTHETDVKKLTHSGCHDNQSLYHGNYGDESVHNNYLVKTSGALCPTFNNDIGCRQTSNRKSLDSTVHQKTTKSGYMLLQSEDEFEDTEF